MHIENQLLRDTYIDINLDLLEENIRNIRNAAGDDVAIMAVVKANGYGHGAKGIAPILMENGVRALGVATLGEALELKESYPNYPVQIIGYTPDAYLGIVVEKNIIQTVFSYEQAELINEYAKKMGVSATVHLKVDTGFHRLGKEASCDYEKEILDIFKLENINVEGIFSHLALAGDEENRRQFSLFEEFTDKLEALGCNFRYKHIADSIAFVDYPEYRMNMVRVGALMYGMRGFHKGSIDVKPVMTFKTKISQLRKVKKGDGVSYDFLWKADNDSLIATLPFGYGDGYPRQLQGKGYVVIRGVKCPLVGIMCMDQVMADVTNVSGIREGDDVLIYGDGSDGALTVDEAAKLISTNKNDILCRLSARPQRIYRYKGEILYYSS